MTCPFAVVAADEALAGGEHPVLPGVALRGGVRAGRGVGGQGEVADDGPRHRPPRLRRRGEDEARLDVDDGLGERCPEGPGRRRAGGRYAGLPLRPSAARTQAADVHRRGGAGAARGEGEHGVDPVDGYVHVAGGQGQQPGGADGAVAVGAGGAGLLAVRGEPDRPARHRDPDGLTGQRRRPADRARVRGRVRRRRADEGRRRHQRPGEGRRGAACHPHRRSLPGSAVGARKDIAPSGVVQVRRVSSTGVGGPGSPRRVGLGFAAGR